MVTDAIPRPLYMNRVRQFLGKDLIKVFVGQRRVGKSWLMFEVERELRRQAMPPTIIRVDKERHEFDAIRDDSDLIEFVERHARGDRNALFVDEVQEISQFERALRSLNATGRYDIYCSGSNANLLSRELSTLLAGRCIEIDVFALTYPEFLDFHGLEDSDDAVRRYLRYGGLPYLRHLEMREEVVFEYLRNICQTILYRDIVSRHGLRNCDLLERLVAFLSNNVGSLVSAHRISDFLKSQRLSTSPKVILEYLGHLHEACFVARVPRYDIKGKRLFEINDKYYFGDLGLRNAIAGGQRPDDINKVLENAVCHHLRARGYRLKVGVLTDAEIDFVAEKEGKIEYYQVAYMLPDETVVEREFGNLARIPDQYPKYVVSMDPMAGGDWQGVLHLPLREFLKLKD